MSKSGNQNTPEPGDKANRNSPENILPQSAEQSLHSLFLQDISSVKNFAALRGKETTAGRETLLEAIFNATITRSINLAVREFRILGAGFSNTENQIGSLDETARLQYLSSLKGEMNDKHADKSLWHKILQLQREKELKEKQLNGIKDPKVKGKINGTKDLKFFKQEGKEYQTGLESHSYAKNDETEIIPSEDIDIDLKDRRYNIANYIRKATELELSMTQPTDQPKDLFSRLEKTQAFEIGVSSIQSNALSIERLKHCIRQFGRGKILVVGDLLIDELLEGRPERISREAPVLILEHVETVLIPGGAANTAHNVTALGGKCHAIGVIGNDEYADKLKALLDKHKISHGLVVDAKRPTTVKTRILSQTHAMMQQLLRLDRISRDPIDKTVEKCLVDELEKVCKEYAVLVLSDYRAGLMTDEIIHACKKISAKQNLTLIVDAQDQFERFQNVSLLTPNQPDTENAIGFTIKDQKDLIQAGEDMLLLTGAKAVLMTRGKDGMALFRQGIEPFQLPAFNRSEVYDVSGAGDTVVATIALGLSTGASLPEAIALGNIAASIVVTKPGTAVTSQEEMLEALPTIKLPGL